MVSVTSLTVRTASATMLFVRFFYGCIIQPAAVPTAMPTPMPMLMPLANCIAFILLSPFTFLPPFAAALLRG